MLKRTFECMASNCEIHLDTMDPLLMNLVAAAVIKEATRIEAKFSRYLDESVLTRINQSNGQPVSVDEETALLIDFAYTCFELSDGLIDVTTGSLRKIWSFKNPEAKVPSALQIESVLKMVGLRKAQWNKRSRALTLPKGMEFDFGGIGKEYAVDRSVLIAKQVTSTPCLVNFGGDLAALRPPKSGLWKIGIEGSTSVLSFASGGLATSGDEKRYLKDGARIFSHILNPKTGWAVESPFVSITVKSDTCTNAGILATLAHLKPHPDVFLRDQGVQFWTRVARE